jgi:hypothetical protein
VNGLSSLPIQELGKANETTIQEMNLAQIDEVTLQE